MTEDHYATLGVAPRSDAAVIRAAYLALMRLYHPDKNDSPAATERAQAVIAAFAVVGDGEKRLHYDWARRRAAEAAAIPPRRQFGTMPRAMVAAAVVLLVAVPYVMLQRPATDRDVPTPSTTPAAAPLADAARKPPRLAQREAVTAPLALPAPVAAPVPEVVIQPVRAEPEPKRPPARVVEVTLVRPPAPRLTPAPRDRAPAPARKAAAPQKPTPVVNEKCRSVRPGAEAAICANDHLAALDRNAVTFYNQSLMFGAPAKRGALLDSRNNFLARREACRSDDCLRNVHLSHLREISVIVESKPSAPPLAPAAPR